MGFEIALVNTPPVADIEDPRDAQATFFTQIGYYSEGYDPKTKARNIFESVPFRIFSDHFLKNPTSAHKVDDIAARLKTTVATVYRHLNKIKRLDILDEVELGKKVGVKAQKGYRLRYGSFPEAWRFTETDIEASLDHYRILVDNISETYGRGGRGSGGKKGGDDGDEGTTPRTGAVRGGKGGPTFRLRVVNTILDQKEEDDQDLLLLMSLDYLSPRGTAGKSKKEIRGSIGYRMFMECFLERSDRLWGYDDLCTALDTTFPTVSRYITKLKALDLLEEVPMERGEDEPAKKGFHLRYGDLSRAWNITEAQARAAVRNYRRSVDRLGDLAGSR
jgi:AcrR family transcriptional regulator